MMQTAIIVALAVLGGLNIYLFWQLRRLRNRFVTTLGGTESANLERSLSGYYERVNQAGKKLEMLAESHQRLQSQAGIASQKISIVRYNPFGDTGGDQSFSLAVLDAHDSGYILTSIHGRESTRTYIKPIDYGTSKYTLSKEEQRALQQAAKRVPETKPARDKEE